MKKEFVLFDFFFHFLFQIPSKETKQTKSKENFEQSNLFIFGIFVFKRKIRTKQAKNYCTCIYQVGPSYRNCCMGDTWCLDPRTNLN